jgi:uncharacterized RDD family membrane protein YckC
MITFFGKETVGIWPRFVSSIIDGAVISIFFSHRTQVFRNGHWVQAGSSGWIDMLYAAILIAVFSATIGKMIMGLQVVRTDGSKVDFGRALLREFAKILSGLALGLGFLWAAFDEKNQTWHDKIADTLVVRK